MVKIPTYTAGHLASEQVGVPAQDQSGVIVGNAIAGLAGKAATLIEESLSKQRDLYRDSQKAKILGEYASQMVMEADQIRTTFSKEPDKAVMQLKEYRNELKSSYLAKVDDSLMKQEMDATLTNLNTRELLQDLTWQADQINMLTRLNFSERISNDAKFLSGPVSYLDYIDRIDSLLDSRDVIISSFRNPTEGAKFVENGIEAGTRGFIYGKIDRGESFEVAQFLASGKFDRFITSEVKLELEDRVEAALKGEQKRSKVRLAAEVSDSVFETIKSLDQKSLPQLEDEIGDIQFRLEQAKVLKNPVEEKIYQDKFEIYTLLRDAKLEAIATTAKDDVKTKGGFLSDFQRLVKTEDGESTLAGTYDEVLDFQKKATQAFYDGKLSKDTYSSWMVFTQAALSEGVANHIVPRRWAGIPQEGLATEASKKNPEVLSRNPVIKKGMHQVLSGFSRDTKHPEDAMRALEFFMNAVYQQTDGNLGAASDLTDEALANLVQYSKRKAMALKLGVSGDHKIGDILQEANGSWEIIGVREDGEYNVRRAR